MAQTLAEEATEVVIETYCTTSSFCGANSGSPPPSSGPKWIAGKQFPGMAEKLPKEAEMGSTSSVGTSRQAVQMIAHDFELFIFDCDGVLVDSEPIINRAHAEVLTACGYSITEQELVGRFCGMSDPDMLDIIEREWGRALPISYGERVGFMIESGFRQSLAAIEGVAEMLDGLQVPVCVASSSAPEQIRRKLELTGLLARFSQNLFSATMVARGKPAPDLFLYAAQQLATAPDRCLVIEDSPAGIDAALAAGMTAIGFCGGSHCGPEHGTRLQARGAVVVISDMREVATLWRRTVDIRKSPVSDAAGRRV